MIWSEIDFLFLFPIFTEPVLKLGNNWPRKKFNYIDSESSTAIVKGSKIIPSFQSSTSGILTFKSEEKYFSCMFSGLVLKRWNFFSGIKLNLKKTIQYHAFVYRCHTINSYMQNWQLVSAISSEYMISENVSRNDGREYDAFLYLLQWLNDEWWKWEFLIDLLLSNVRSVLWISNPWDLHFWLSNYLSN